MLDIEFLFHICSIFHCLFAFIEAWIINIQSTQSRLFISEGVLVFCLHCGESLESSTSPGWMDTKQDNMQNVPGPRSQVPGLVVECQECWVWTNGQSRSRINVFMLRCYHNITMLLNNVNKQTYSHALDIWSTSQKLMVEGGRFTSLNKCFSHHFIFSLSEFSK